MNKYQEALDRLYFGYTQNVDGIHPDYKLYSSTEYPAKLDKDKLQELVDKETPMKVAKQEWVDKVVGKVKEYQCPSCNKTVDLVSEEYPGFYNFFKSHYCCHCGQKLDWSSDK